MSQGVVQFIGTLVVLAVVLQVLVMAASAVRRFTANNESRRISLDLLRLRADTALQAFNYEKERVELGWNGSRKFEIHRKQREAEGVHSFYLVPHDGKPLPPFLPGQYLTFQLRIPGQPKPIIRCYSLSDSPNNPDYYRVSIKKVPPPRDQPDKPPGLSSTYFNDMLQEDDILDIKAPSGQFFLDMTSERPIVFVGGGIGLTPVLSMLTALTESGIRREVWFFLGVRNGEEHLMKEQLEALNQANENLHLHVCYSVPQKGDEKGRDYQHSGHVSVDLFKELLPSNNYTFYICGPPPMMEFLTAGLKEWGVPEDDVHFEAFGPATVKKTKAKVPEAGEAEAVEVVFDRSGKTLKWDAGAETLLEFAEDNGIVIDSGCRAGNCGTCIVAVKSGEVTYVTDPGVTPEEGSCLTCVAMPKTALTLDA